jgi:hypothetical protein
MPEIPKVDMKNVNADSLKGGFGDILAILNVFDQPKNQAAMDRVAGRDSEGISLGLVYLAIGAIAAPLGQAIFGYSVLGFTYRTPVVNALILAVLQVVMAALVIYVASFVAVKMFQGHAKFPQFFRVIAYASLINVVNLLTMVQPLLSLLSGLLLLVIEYLALVRIHKLNSTNAVLTIIITMVVMFVIGALIGVLGLTSMGLSGGVALGR